MIKLILEVDRICKKHGLKWFAFAGTLLGTVRHKGFIPWDDDVDLGMLRPDYEKFVRVAPSELDSHFFLDNWIDYRLEEEAAFDQSIDETLPVLSEALAKKIRDKKWFWPIRAGYSKLRDSNTTQIQWSSRKNVNQGIWIDIFPLDFVSTEEDGAEHRQDFEIAKELFLIASDRPKVLLMLKQKQQFVMPIDRIKKLLELPFRQRALEYEKHLADNFGKTPNVSWLTSFMRRGKSFKLTAFDKTIELPYELASLACPAGYDELLTSWYGDWHEIVFRKCHTRIWSDNISYRDYLTRVTR